uniref:Dual specificity phosphatase 27 n=1 Tax=Lepisosteus oculatus TaxID=7918 RepID=W5MTY9_LEPOC
AVAMASRGDPAGEQVVPEEEDAVSVRSVQARYLRSPSPSRFSIMSDADTESIFMEPIHLSPAVAAKQIINEELKPKELKVEPGVPETMMESAEQLLVEDLYNRVKDMMDDSSPFDTPCVLDIQRALTQDRLEAPTNPVDEVWPNIFIAEKAVAVNKSRLKRLGITHILNTAHGTGVYTGPDFYTGMNIQYMGIEVDDFPEMDISQHFRPAAEFLDEALLTHRGKVLVDSMMGVSRSAVLVAAYMMIFHHMTIMEALMTLRKKRPIYPNESFLRQLRELNETLLEERGGVIQAKTHSVMAEEEESGSVMGAKAHSIFVEEEDKMSTMSSVLTAAAKSSVVSKRPTLIDEDEEDRLYEEWRKKQGLPPSEKPNPKEVKIPRLPEEKEDEDVDGMIREWQRRNEQYQSEDWWRAQLMSEDEQSLLGGSSFSANGCDDLESVNSVDIRALKERLAASGAGRFRSDSVSTEDSAADIWTKRLREIEEEAAARYGDKGRGATENGTGEKEIDEESLFSETSSLYNFCKKNKEKLTPLERWRIKRIQFGWNKKDAEAEKAEGGSVQGEEEETKVASGEVNLTAYQNWKLKHQKKLGTENKDEIVELSKGEDTASIKKKQRRAEILERSRQTLEESQSMCGWDTESSMSGSIPLSAIWPTMSARSISDDTTSMLSMQSNRSSFSQSRNLQGLPPAPITPLPNIQVGNDDAISLASIQNWIANVVTETIIQKQNELLMQGGLPPSRSPSVMSSGARPGAVGKYMDDDKVSLLSMQSGVSYASSSSRQRELPSTDSHSVLSCSSLSNIKPEGHSSKDKITRTSKPLYSLFADDVDLKKLDTKDKEMKSEMRGKMSAYEKEKIAADNKRSTLFRRKKAKDDKEDEDDTMRASGNYSYTKFDRSDRSDTVPNITGQLSRSVTESADKTSSIDKWLNDIKTPSRYQQKSYGGESSEAKFPRSSYTKEDNIETSYSKSSRGWKEFSDRSLSSLDEVYKSSSRFSSKEPSTASDLHSSDRFGVHSYDDHRRNSTELYDFRRSATTEEATSNIATQKHRSQVTYSSEDDDSEDNHGLEYGAKRRFTQSFSKSEENNRETKRSDSDDEEAPLNTWYRIKSKPKEDEELDDDEVITAWRRQQESKSRTQRRREI